MRQQGSAVNADEMALESRAVTAPDERLPVALCWLISGAVAAGLWALILTPFLT